MGVAALCPDAPPLPGVEAADLSSFSAISLDFPDDGVAAPLAPPVGCAFLAMAQSQKRGAMPARSGSEQEEHLVRGLDVCFVSPKKVEFFANSYKLFKALLSPMRAAHRTEYRRLA